MICFNCDQTNWHLIEKEFTGWEDRQLGICKTCGTIAYQVDPSIEEKVKEYYRKEYRSQIGFSNLLTTSRKLNYIKGFIEPWLLEKEKEKKQLVIGDVGCATGYMLDWFRRRGHKATGSEWTITMRRFAEHFYGIPTTEELTEKHKYDLIIMYHVLEHLVEPDKKLLKYKEMLSENGQMLIATPQWLDILEESGSGKVSDFKNLYHKDHINVFTSKSLKSLFLKCGLAIEKQDHIVYGQTYLLRKIKPNEQLTPDHIKENGFRSREELKENWEEVWKQVQIQKKAIDLYRRAMSETKDSLFRDALLAWPLFPDAYYEWVLNSTQKKDRGRCAELIEEAMKKMPGNVKIHIIRAYFLYQNENWQAALEDFDYLIKTKINEDFIMFKGYCLYHLGRLKESMNAFHEASLLNPQKWTESMTWICKCATEQKSWDEVAIEELKNKMFENAKVTLVPKDPVFETNGKQEEKKGEEVKVV